MLNVRNGMPYSMETKQQTPLCAKAFLGDHRCFACILDKMNSLLDAFNATPDERSAFVAELAARYSDHGVTTPPTDFLREAYHALAKRYRGVFPFWQYKKSMNDLALELQPALRVRVKMGSNSFRNAMRIALVATRIDFAKASAQQIMTEVDEGIRARLAIDDGELLKSRIHNDSKIVYLADRAGEIVFDRTFIRTIPGAEVYYVVNCPYAGFAASGQDADYVSMRECAKVLANGCEAPNTLPEVANERFHEILNEADIIIAKGQTNLEAMYAYHDPRLFAIFTCRCNLVAQQFGIAVGDSVIMHVESHIR